MFSGSARITVSLVVIMIEISNDLNLLPPIMLCVAIAKWVGDYLYPTLYDILLDLKHVPFLESDPPYELTNMVARDIMVSPVVTLPLRASVEEIIETLRVNNYHGFPVVGPGHWFDRPILQGVILRKHLNVILSKRIWAPRKPITADQFRGWVAQKDHRASYIDRKVTMDERKTIIDLTPYMNVSPFSVHEGFSAVYAFQLFRGLALRHLPVVTAEGLVVGILTRKDLVMDVVKRRYEDVAQKPRNLGIFASDSTRSVVFRPRFGSLAKHV